MAHTMTTPTVTVLKKQPSYPILSPVIQEQSRKMRHLILLVLLSIAAVRSQIDSNIKVTGIYSEEEKTETVSYSKSTDTNQDTPTEEVENTQGLGTPEADKDKETGEEQYVWHRIEGFPEVEIDEETGIHRIVLNKNTEVPMPVHNTHELKTEGIPEVEIDKETGKQRTVLYKKPETPTDDEVHNVHELKTEGVPEVEIDKETGKKRTVLYKKPETPTDEEVHNVHEFKTEGIPEVEIDKETGKQRIVLYKKPETPTDDEEVHNIHELKTEGVPEVEIDKETGKQRIVLYKKPETPTDDEEEICNLPELKNEGVPEVQIDKETGKKRIILYRKPETPEGEDDTQETGHATDKTQEAETKGKQVSKDNTETEEALKEEDQESIFTIIENGKKAMDELSPYLLVEEWLSLYGILQQMEYGENTHPRPDREDFKETAKWEAWKAMSGRTPQYLEEPLSVLINVYIRKLNQRMKDGPNWH